MPVSSFKPAEEVQRFLDTLPKGEDFRVEFVKQDGTPRELTGHLDPLGQTRKQAVPIMTPDGWKSFLIHRVIDIKRARGSNS